MSDTTSTAPDTAIEASPDALREALRETILFAELDDEQLDHIAAASSVQSLDRKSVV